MRFLTLILLGLLLPSAARAESAASVEIAAATLAGEQCHTAARADVAVVGTLPADADLVCAG